MWLAELGTNVSVSSCGGVEDADLARAEGGDVERRAVAASPPCRAGWRGSCPSPPPGGRDRCSRCACSDGGADTLLPSSTVMRLSAGGRARWCRRTCRDAPAPSKRTSLRASVFDDVDLAAHRVHRHVEEDGADVRVEAAGPPIATGGVALASIAKTSLSGRLNFTALFQLRPSSSVHVRAVALDDQPDLGPRGRRRSCAPGSAVRPAYVAPWMVQEPATTLSPLLPSSQTTPSESAVVWLPE